MTELVIPEGVERIASFAFYNCTSIKTLTLSKDVTSIGHYAFYCCTALERVTFSDTVASVESFAFNGCTALKGVYITDLASFCKMTFDNLDNPLAYAKNLYLNGVLVEELVIPEGINAIGYHAFGGMTSLKSVTLPDTVKTIDEYAFYECGSLEYVVIGKSLRSVSKKAFYNCTSLSRVYYAGTAEDWAKITISSDNTPLKNATVYYYSETEPVESGNYWHYVDGTITLW